MKDSNALFILIISAVVKIVSSFYFLRTIVLYSQMICVIFIPLFSKNSQKKNLTTMAMDIL